MRAVAERFAGTVFPIFASLIAERYKDRLGFLTWVIFALSGLLLLYSWGFFGFISRVFTGKTDWRRTGSLLRRTRRMIKRLIRFVDANEGNVTAVHFLYDAKFRGPVDTLFSELAAEEVCDVVEGDWVVNPQIQTAKNIRESVIPLLERAEKRLEAKKSAPKSKLIGDIESGKFTVRGSSTVLGKVVPNSNVCVRLRVTNKENIETTVKRANLRVVVDGETYAGTKTTLWYPREAPDFLEKITRETPIKHGPATVGSLEFMVEGLSCPDRGVRADVTVTLVDEFDVSHAIRNKSLWLAA